MQLKHDLDLLVKSKNHQDTSAKAKANDNKNNKGAKSKQNVKKESNFKEKNNKVVSTSSLKVSSEF